MILNRACFLVILFLLSAFIDIHAEDNLNVTLSDCISHALENNFDLKIEQESIKNAEFTVQQNKAYQKPQVNFDASYLRVSEVMETNFAPRISGFQIQPVHLRFGDEDNYTTRLNVSQNLFSGFKVKNNIKASENQLNASKSNEKAHINTLIFKVKQTYYNLLNAQNLHKVQLLSLESVESHLKDVENMYEQGMVAKNEVLKVELKKSEIELNINKAENSIELIRQSLLQLMGMDLNTELSLQDDLSLTMDSVSEEKSHNNLSKRPELTTLSYQLKSYANIMKAAKGDYLPTINMIGFYEYGKPGLNKLENDWMGYWTVGINAKWSLWDWGIKKSRVEKNQSGAKQFELFITKTATRHTIGYSKSVIE